MNEQQRKALVQRIATLPRMVALIREMQNENDGVKIDELEIVLTVRKEGKTIWQFEEVVKVGR